MLIDTISQILVFLAMLTFLFMISTVVQPKLLKYENWIVDRLFGPEELGKKQKKG